MIWIHRNVSVKQLYILTAVVAFGGAAFFFARYGWRVGIAFLLGSAVSLGNLWVFQWLATSIAPGERSQKPWEAGAFVSRYVIFFGAGYAIVKTLGVSPLPVVLGLFASTAAVLISSLVELFGSLRKAGRT